MFELRIATVSALLYTPRYWRRLFKHSYFVVLLACTLFLTHLAQPSVASSSTLLGIYYGVNGINNIAQIQALETWQGKKNSVVNLFTTWCNQTSYMDQLFNQQLVEIWDNQNVPMITWQPFACTSSSTPTDIDLQVANGEYDTYLNNWSDRMYGFLCGPDGVYSTADDRRAYIRFAHEMNGDWYPWSALPNGTVPSDYIKMWQRVKSLFYNKGMDWTHLQWIWSVNFTDNGWPTPYTAESYYPGDNYVDWVAISGYNWGATQWWSTWIEPEQTFGLMLSRLRALTTKPVAITEIGCTTQTSSGTNISAKSQWITDAYNYLLNNNIKMIAWFNEEKETDWSIFGGLQGNNTFAYNSTVYNIYDNYKAALTSNSLVSTDTTNPRLLTDVQFAGL